MSSSVSLLESAVCFFLKRHCNFSKPILLGLSGGPDSLCLLHVLLKCRDFFSFTLHVAHIDHGWREESAFEAKELQRMAENLSLPFHLKTINPDSLKGNLEAACRQERLHFFSKICHEFDCQATLLAHHADDQAETILKKIFEGSHLSNLGGMQDISLIERMMIWRPLLKISKKEIAEWLLVNHLKGFDDKTNYDNRFLRSRLRSNLIPLLSDHFGKEVGGALCRLGKEMQEVKEYFDLSIEPYWNLVIDSALGSYIDLSRSGPKTPVELKFLLKTFFANRGVFLSFSIMENLIDMVFDRVANRKFIMGNHTIFCDRGIIFIPNFPNKPDSFQSFNLAPGSYVWGKWMVEVTEVESDAVAVTSSWRDLWKGFCRATLNKGEYTLSFPPLRSPYRGSTPLTKWWSDHKVPAFLREISPIILEKEVVQHEFLTGKMLNRKLHTTKKWNITLQYDTGTN